MNKYVVRVIIDIEKVLVKAFDINEEGLKTTINNILDEIPGSLRSNHFIFEFNLEGGFLPRVGDEFAHKKMYELIDKFEAEVEQAIVGNLDITNNEFIRGWGEVEDIVFGIYTVKRVYFTSTTFSGGELENSAIPIVTVYPDWLKEAGIKS